MPGTRTVSGIGELLPDRGGMLEMTWADLLFAHWPVAPETVATRLPAALDVDTFEGEAWLGVVAFVMEDIRPRGLPFGLTFGEVNLRTYVRDDGGGIYFFNLDADDPLGVTVARRLFRLPYYRAETSVDRSAATDGRIEFRCRRVTTGVPPARFEASYGPARDATAFRPEPGTLPHFLTERYRFYTTDDRGRLYHGDIRHAPWELREAWADIEDNTLFAASGFDRPDGEPVLHYAPRTDVTAGRLRRE